MANPTNKYESSIGLQQPSSSDLTDGTTGSGGGVVLATSPTISSPTLSGTTTIAQITKYIGLLSAPNTTGTPFAVASVTATGQTANIGSTLLISSGSAAAMYLVNAYISLTTAATTSSTLPTAQIIFNDPSGTAVTINVTPTLAGAGLGQTGALTANVVGTVTSGSVPIYVQGGSTAINYLTTGYASVGATSMAYTFFLVLEKL